jgi:WS/DGAT/MGAT family acyltransferase
VVDPDFDLGHHLQRVELTAPAAIEQVLELAERMAMAPFERSRPLWSAALVEGLEGGRAAYVLRVHHSVADGQGTVQLLGILHSRRREPSPHKPMPAPPAPETTSGVAVLAGQMARRARTLPGLGAQFGRAARLTRRLARDPAGEVAHTVELARSLGRVLNPPPAPPSPLLRERGLTWRFGILEAPLDELKEAGRAAGGALGDAYVAALLGGLRRYHECHGVAITALPMAMPISVRAAGDAGGGNRFAAARLAAPVGERDPAARIRAVHAAVQAARSEPAVDAVGVLAPALAALPAGLMGEVQLREARRLDLQATNVPGLRHAAYLAGARIERLYPFGPVPGCAVMAALLSHGDTCCIGINCDAAAVTDVPALMACLEEGLDEVLTLAR